MCNPEFKKSHAPALRHSSSSSFLSVEAFTKKPSIESMASYAVGALTFLFGVEYMLRYGFERYQMSHPLLENETNRLILARHIGTDFLCCALVAAMGIAAFKEVCPGFLPGKKGDLSPGGYEARMFTYRPAAMRICLFFASYQIKNLYDTLVWGDGFEFIAHHVMCLGVAYGTIFHGIAHYHVPFYFGVSEVSTAILCLLANFDDTHGVPGLAEAFPEAKVVLGGLFAVAFIACRVFLWSFFSYYFIPDCYNAITKTDSSRDAARPWNKVLLGGLSGLSVLQVIWLGQIIMVAKEELAKL